MQIEFGEAELVLNREWIYDDPDDDPIGETNFVVPYKWVEERFKNFYQDAYSNFEEFLECYVPEEEGTELYKAAKKEKVLIEDLGELIYD